MSTLTQATAARLGALPALFMGGTVGVPGSVQPDDILRLTEQHHITAGFGNPFALAPRLAAVTRGAGRYWAGPAGPGRS